MTRSLMIRMMPLLLAGVLAACGAAGDATVAGKREAVLTVVRIGGGVVRSLPAAIDCGTACVAAFASGQSVNLQALPDDGARFEGWSGACSGTGLACTLILNGPTAVTARFSPLGVPPVSLSDSKAYLFGAPAGLLKTATQTTIDGIAGAVLPNGRFVTPAGCEIGVQATKPFGMALSPDGKYLATVNSKAPNSLTLIGPLSAGCSAAATLISLRSAYWGVVFSPDSKRFYVANGDDGNVLVGEVAAGKITGSVNLNTGHPMTRPLAPTAAGKTVNGAYAGRMAMSRAGILYVTDQAGFKVHVIDTRLVQTGTDANGAIVEPDNFAAVMGAFATGYYPFGIGLSPDERRLYVGNIGVFKFSYLPKNEATGDDPICYPVHAYPDDVRDAKTIRIKKVDPGHLPASTQDAEGIRCGYVSAGEQTYTVPGLGDPNAPEASSVFVYDLSDPLRPRRAAATKTGTRIGEREDNGIISYSGSHPNAIAATASAVYVANGNDDTISVLDTVQHEEIGRIPLTPLSGYDARYKGVQPVGLALAPDGRRLYVAEAGLNAVGVVDLAAPTPRQIGLIPTSWWTSAVAVSADGKTLYAASARGHGGGPNSYQSLHPASSSMLGTVQITPLPADSELPALTRRVLANNGLVPGTAAADGGPLPNRPGLPSDKIRHVIFINKENASYDYLLGHIPATLKGDPVDGQPQYSLGAIAAVNHTKLALDFALSDNFYLEPNVSSDGHRWLTGIYTTEFEESHWTSAYGCCRDFGGEPYPGRLAFAGSNASPEPHDYNKHGSVYVHLVRNGKTIFNFGNGFEFAGMEEGGGLDPTGGRQHVNIPMEKVVRDNSDHMYPEFNTHIPDAPLPDQPGRFSRFGRFRQVFEDRFVDRAKDQCKLPNFVDLYYPNDHSGGADSMNGGSPTGLWPPTRYIQDNDAALGLTVDLLSHSPCWKDTVIFVTEDDTQSGNDHVDGTRVVFLAIGPWIKRNYASHVHASLPSVFKTTYELLGLPPLNLYDAAVSDLRDLFADTPDYTPYDFIQPVYQDLAGGPAGLLSVPGLPAPLLAPGLPEIQAKVALWQMLSRDIDFSRPDADEDRLREALQAAEGLPRPPFRSLKAAVADLDD